VTCVVVGASSGLGRALAESLARRGRSLLLASSDERDLHALAADLRLTANVTVAIATADAADPTGLAERIDAALGEAPLEAVFLPLGASDDDADDGSMAPDRAEALVRVNFLAVTAVVARLLPRLQARRAGVIAGFGSVAAERGRSRNVVYAAAKRALESYFESLRHRLEPEGIAVVLYTLGYVDTNLAFGRPLPFPKADPRRLAESICDEMGRARGRRYRPAWWRPIAFALRHTPWFVYRRLRF
jgi:short-subunit dehydrogenase